MMRQSYDGKATEGWWRMFHPQPNEWPCSGCGSSTPRMEAEIHLPKIDSLSNPSIMKDAMFTPWFDTSHALFSYHFIDSLTPVRLGQSGHSKQKNKWLPNQYFTNKRSTPFCHGGFPLKWVIQVIIVLVSSKKPSGFYLNDRIEAPHRKSVSGCCSVERNQDVLLYAYANLTTSPVRIGVLPSRKTAPLFEDNLSIMITRGGEKSKKRKNPLTSRDLYHHSHTSNYEKD
ncbi:hypothetical protein GQR58_009309 [Nymphon striatum]|nr:hypothetical protein GQR58_009309 [Nymphon striatum]